MAGNVPVPLAELKSCRFATLGRLAEEHSSWYDKKTGVVVSNKKQALGCTHADGRSIMVQLQGMSMKLKKLYLSKNERGNVINMRLKFDVTEALRTALTEARNKIAADFMHMSRYIVQQQENKLPTRFASCFHLFKPARQKDVDAAQMAAYQFANTNLPTWPECLELLLPLSGKSQEIGYKLDPSGMNGMLCPPCDTKGQPAMLEQLEGVTISDMIVRLDGFLCKDDVFDADWRVVAVVVDANSQMPVMWAPPRNSYFQPAFALPQSIQSAAFHPLPPPPPPPPPPTLVPLPLFALPVPRVAAPRVPPKRKAIEPPPLEAEAEAEEEEEEKEEAVPTSSSERKVSADETVAVSWDVADTEAVEQAVQEEEDSPFMTRASPPPPHPRRFGTRLGIVPSLSAAVGPAPKKKRLL